MNRLLYNHRWNYWRPAAAKPLCAEEPETCFDSTQDFSLTECAATLVCFFSASKAAIDIMPTPEPIATPVPVNAQRERIESDAYIAVEELIFAEGFLSVFVLFVWKKSRERRVSQRQIRNLKNKSQRRRVYATDPSSIKRSIHAKQTSNRPFPSRLVKVYNYIIWSGRSSSLLGIKFLSSSLCRKFYSRKTKKKKSETPLLKQQQRERAIANASTNSRGRGKRVRDARRKRKRNVLYVGVGEWYSNVCVKVMINSAVGCLSYEEKLHSIQQNKYLIFVEN